MFFVPAVNERTNGARSVFANQKNFFLNITRLARYFPSSSITQKNKKSKIKKIKNQKKNQN